MPPRLPVANCAEVQMSSSSACAESIGTAQVVCYVWNVALGEMVRGRIPNDEHRTAATRRPEGTAGR